MRAKRLLKDPAADLGQIQEHHLWKEKEKFLWLLRIKSLNLIELGHSKVLVWSLKGQTWKSINRIVFERENHQENQ